MTPMAHRSAPRTADRSGLVFLLFALAVAMGNVLVIQAYPRIASGPIPEWPVLVDLVLFVPVVYLLLHWRRGKDAWLSALALAGFGILVGSLALPDASKQVWRMLEDLRYLVLAGFVLFQLGIITLVVRQVVKARHDRNLEQAVDEALVERFGDSVFSRVMRLESRVWLYGLVRNPVHRPFPGQAAFPVGKQGMNASNQWAFLILVGAEIPIAHALIYLFSPWVATIVSVLSLYGFLFLVADYRASMRRPITLTEGALHVRHGVVHDLVVPWSQIRSAAPANGTWRRARGRVRAIGMGEANVRIELEPGTTLPGLLGEGAVAEIILGVDDPSGFIAAVRQRIRQD